MIKLLALILGSILNILSLKSQTGYVATRNTMATISTDRYVIGSPGNTYTNSFLVEKVKDSTYLILNSKNILITSIDTKSTVVPNNTDRIIISRNGTLTPTTLLQLSSVIGGTTVSNTYNGADGIMKLGAEPSATFAINRNIIMTLDTANKAIAEIMDSIALKANTSSLSNYYTKNQSDIRYLQSYSESDPIWLSDKSNYYTKTQSDSRYLQSFTEVDGSITNEIQTPSINGNTLSLSGTSITAILPSFTQTVQPVNLSISGQSLSAGSNTVVIPTQTVPITISGANATSISGSYPNFTVSSPAQTLQTLSGSGTNTITLSNGGGTFLIPVQTPIVYQAANGLLQNGTNPVTFSVDSTKYLTTVSAGTTIASMQGSINANSNNINGKQDKLNGVGFVKANGTTITYDNSTYLTAETQSLSLNSNSLSIKSGTNTINSIVLPSQTTQTLVGTNGLTVTSGVNSYTISRTKRQETYSGTTDASGLYTVTFGTTFSAAPNIQAQLIGGNDLTFFRIISVSTTGFQIYAFTRSTVNSLPIIGTLGTLLLGSAANPLLGANIDVLITEK